ncbi:MAG: hypothetical protein H6718_09840 [Polyangiaceae bacterium]|nr:hypothetical protein [Myxococcales bacterium]MCB9585690.1 hypothetical protein [Polyangiaceae bacterium]MCB9607381.1 hypothetical protein [Polyangiaceae bacterium]
MTSLGATLSVPCGRCTQPIRFGQVTCRCGEVVSIDSKRALEERLKASSSEYREFDFKLARARLMLVVCAIGQLGFGALLWLFAANGESAFVHIDGLTVSLAIDALAALGFVGACYVSLRQPMRGIAVGALVWGASQLSAWRMETAYFVEGWYIAGGILLVLLRGFFAARDAERLRRRLLADGPAATP